MHESLNGNIIQAFVHSDNHQLKKSNATKRRATVFTWFSNESQFPNHRWSKEMAFSQIGSCFSARCVSHNVACESRTMEPQHKKGCGRKNNNCDERNIYAS